MRLVGGPKGVTFTIKVNTDACVQALQIILADMVAQLETLNDGDLEPEFGKDIRYPYALRDSYWEWDEYPTKKD